MGTRADFYVKRDGSLEWRASIGWDGYVDRMSKSLLLTKTEYDFDTELEKFLYDRKDVTRPADGWPWPWKNSKTTDYAYIFDIDAQEVKVSCFGGGLYNFAAYREYKVYEKECNKKTSNGEDVDIKDIETWIASIKGQIELPEFPDMTNVQNVTLGKRSGLMVIGDC